MKQKGKAYIKLGAVLFVLLFGVSMAYGAIPEGINYQGYLTDNSGNPVNATVSMTFRL